MGNFSYVSRALDLGDLNGNRFHVTLRRLAPAVEGGGAAGNAAAAGKAVAAGLDEGLDEGVVGAACEALKESGFINFFGLQRFGSGGGKTAQVGLAMLKQDWSGAIDLILMRRQGDDEETVIAKHMWAAKKDAAAAAKLMPSQVPTLVVC